MQDDTVVATVVRATVTGARVTGPEDELVAAVRAGDELAFARLVRRHERELRAHCARLLRGRPDAEDAVQETFLSAWRHRARFEGRASYRGWLFRIATNTCLDLLRRPASSRSRAVGWVAGDDGGPEAARPAPATRFAAHTAAPDDALVARETVELALLAALEHLPARQRAVLTLRDLLGWTAEDTADLLGTSPAGVNSALQRARATLQAHRPADRQHWSPAGPPSRRRRLLVRHLMAAGDRDDGPAVAALARLAG
jgi:RNA polymerase sigma-70 factor (ECF subfamily)